jgi:hypothetical protein
MAAKANTSWSEWDLFRSFSQAREASKARGANFIRLGPHYAVPKTRRSTGVVVYFSGGGLYSACRLAGGGIVTVKKARA